jgi:predicted phage tail protein
MNIKIHGLLGQIFGKKINIKIGNINQLLLAIDGIKPGFRKKYSELVQNGQLYDAKLINSEIHLIPLVSGSFFKKIWRGAKKAVKSVFKAVKRVVKAIVSSPLGIILLAAAVIFTGGMALGFFGAGAAGGGLFGGLFGGGLFGGGITGFLGNLALQVGFSFLKAGLQMMLMKRPNMNGQQDGGNINNKDQYSGTGGTVSAAQAKSRSYIFDSNLNSATQGRSVPIVYGRMKYAPQIIQMSMNYYPTNETFENQLPNYNLTLL